METQEQSERMTWGKEHEPDGISCYEIETGAVVEKCLDRQEFVPFEDWSGCTPDGIVGNDGIVEIKCPNSMYSVPPTSYYIQVQSQLHHTGRQWADLAVWTPDDFRVWRTSANTDYWEIVSPHLKKYWEVLTSGMEPKRLKKPKLDLGEIWLQIV